MAFFKASLFALLCFSSLLVLAIDSSNAEKAQCGNPWLEVETNDIAEGVSAENICERVSWAIDQMDRCGFSIQQKLIVEVVDELKHPCSLPVVGHFDSVEFKVKVASPDQCRQLLETEAALAKVDFDAVYGSIFVHEAVHAALWKQLDHSEHEPVSAMATEYVAYAFQILSLPTVDRDHLLAVFPRKPPTDLAPFNYFALQISPLRFATNAYRHFMSVDDRCQFLSEVISGAVEFDDWEQYE
jgi:hypothetical protein